MRYRRTPSTGVGRYKECFRRPSARPTARMVMLPGDSGPLHTLGAVEDVSRAGDHCVSAFGPLDISP